VAGDNQDPSMSSEGGLGKAHARTEVRVIISRIVKEMENSAGREKGHEYQSMHTCGRGEHRSRPHRRRRPSKSNSRE
jgi:hypothetical protein